VPWWPLFAASGPSIAIPRMIETASWSCSAVSGTRATVPERRGPEPNPGQHGSDP
jgi:hypothetical protein